MRLRSYLLVLIVGILLPVLLFSGVMLVRFNRQTRAATEKGLVETARALSVAVDRELTASISVLRALATADSLASGDLTAFDRRMRAVLASQPGWENILLYDPSGQQLVNTSRPLGQPLPRTGNPDLITWAVRERTPAISNLFRGSVLARPLVSVVVPVMAGGQVRYVLGMAFRPGVLSELLGAQGMPAGSIAALVDANGVFIARTLEPSRSVGRPASTDLVKKMRASPDTAFPTFTLEGNAIYAGVSRSALSAWTVEVAVPAAAVDRPLRASLWLLAGIDALCVGVALAVGIPIARRLRRSIQGLSRAAGTFVDGQWVEVPPSGVSEIDEVVQGMASGQSRAPADRGHHRRDRLGRAGADQDAGPGPGDEPGGGERVPPLRHPTRDPVSGRRARARAHVRRLRGHQRSGAIDRRDHTVGDGHRGARRDRGAHDLHAGPPPGSAHHAARVGRSAPAVRSPPGRHQHPADRGRPGGRGSHPRVRDGAHADPARAASAQRVRGPGGHRAPEQRAVRAGAGGPHRRGGFGAERAAARAAEPGDLLHPRHRRGAGPHHPRGHRADGRDLRLVLGRERERGPLRGARVVERRRGAGFPAPHRRGPGGDRGLGRNRAPLGQRRGRLHRRAVRRPRLDARARPAELHRGAGALRLVEGDHLVLVATSGGADQIMAPRPNPVTEGLTGEVARTGEPLVVADAASDPRCLPYGREAAARLGYRAWLGVPIKVGDRVTGVLSAWTRRPAGFSADDLTIVGALASQAAVALENDRLYQELERSYRELSQTQAQLMQSQKMEAIGQLAGGIAHDFNNLLTVITGRTIVALSQSTPGSGLHRHLELVKQSADRAAALTHQLLAYSRRQVLQPKVLDLNAVIAGVAPMLQRLIGEDIELRIVRGEGLWPIRVDPGQIEQVIMNLVVNARDAMPDGGGLLMEAANVKLGLAPSTMSEPVAEGAYVMLKVEDTGTGMDEETQRRIFEPFFTTKEVGQGTGLGLATVQDVVSQHGGAVRVYSAPGKGTTFKIYLPRAEGSAEASTGAEGAREAPRGKGTILLVEDEAEVRRLARQVMETAGYTVLEAHEGNEALALCQRNGAGAIDLLLTDVTMPGMSGRELADRLSVIRPTMKVVFVSGYTDDRLGRQGVLEPGVQFLAKPFSPAELLERIHEALATR